MSNTIDISLDLQHNSKKHVENYDPFYSKKNQIELHARIEEYEKGDISLIYKTIADLEEMENA